MKYQFQYIIYERINNVGLADDILTLRHNSQFDSLGIHYLLR